MCQVQVHHAKGLGVIYKMDTPTKATVLTVGVEYDKEAIHRWCMGSMERMERGEEELPDRVGRMRLERQKP